MAIDHVLLCLGLFLIWLVGGDVLWQLYDRLCPVRYYHIPLEGLTDHFDQFLRRGCRSAEMVVEFPERQTVFCIRKWYPRGQPGMEYYVVFPTARRGDVAGSTFRNAMRLRRKDCEFGRARPKKYHNLLACRCADFNEVMEVATLAVSELLCLPKSAEFAVYVKGGIHKGDVVCDGQTPVMAVIAAGLIGARPYKRWLVHKGIYYWVGRLLGAIVREIRGVLWGPDDPSDQLRR